MVPEVTVALAQLVSPAALVAQAAQASREAATVAQVALVAPVALRALAVVVVVERPSASPARRQATRPEPPPTPAEQVAPVELAETMDLSGRSSTASLPDQTW